MEGKFVAEAWIFLGAMETRLLKLAGELMMNAGL